MNRTPLGHSTRLGLEFRAARILACFRIGPPVWERVKPPGYDRVQERCSRCKTLRRQHTLKGES